MLQRFDPGSARLAIGPVGIPPTGDPPRASEGSVMRLPGGDVAGDFKATGIRGGREPSATYELLISNDTAAPLATFAYAADPGSHDRLTWSAIVVPPFSAIAVEIDVAFDRKRARPRVVAELLSEDAHLTIDAPEPQEDVPAIPRRTVALGATALAIAAGAFALVLLRPHVEALAAPATVRGGAPFTVAYALGATGNRGRYVVETPDGLAIRHGVLPGRSGAFTLALPRSRTSLGYDVRVTTSGRLGSSERTAHIVALPPQPTHHPVARVAAIAATAPEALVRDLALERDTVHGGEAIVATYRAASPTGMVRLIDALGTVRAEAMITPRGRSILVAPTVETDQDFRVVVTVERGAAHLDAAVPVTILHGTLASSAPADPIATDLGDPTSVRVPRTMAPIAVNPVQHTAHPIVVRIDAYHPGMHIALMGASTEEIVGRDVAAGDMSVVLTPPERLTEAHYAIVATYETGLGEETLIRPITFRVP